MDHHLFAFLVQVLILLFWTWAIYRDIREYYKTKLDAKDDLYSIDSELKELGEIPREQIDKDPVVQLRHRLAVDRLNAVIMITKDRIRFARLHMILAVTMGLILWTLSLGLIIGYYVKEIHHECPFGPDRGYDAKISDVQVEVHNCTNTVDGVLGPQFSVEVK